MIQITNWKKLSTCLLLAVQLSIGFEIRLLGSTAKLTWRRKGEGTIVDVPDAVRNSPPCRDAFVFELTL